MKPTGLGPLDGDRDEARIYGKVFLHVLLRGERGRLIFGSLIISLTAHSNENYGDIQNYI
jgi:hypothetical protein